MSRSLCLGRAVIRTAMFSGVRGRSCNTVWRESENPAHAELGCGAFLLPFSTLFLTVACRLAPGRTLLFLTGMCEPCALARLFASRSINLLRRAGPQWFWVLFPKQKACPEPGRRRLRLPGRHPASNSYHSKLNSP